MKRLLLLLCLLLAGCGSGADVSSGTASAPPAAEKVSERSAAAVTSLSFSLLASPSALNTGQTVTLKVNGAPPNAYVSLYRRWQGSSSYTYAGQGLTNSSGSYAFSAVAPSVLGQYQFYATSGSSTSNVVTVTVLAGNPVLLTPNPPTLTVGQRGTFSYQNMGPGTLTLYGRPPGGGYSAVATKTVTADFGTLPWTAAAPAGTWSFYAVDAAGRVSGTVSVTVNPVVLPFTVTVTPGSAVTGQNVTVRFTGAAPNATIDITRQQLGSTVFYPASAVANESGEATFVWDTTQYPAGTWNVRGYYNQNGNAAYSNTAQLQLTASPPPGFSISATPSGVYPGQAVTFRIAGATPGATLYLWRVQYGLTGGRVVDYYITAGADGTATASYSGLTYSGTSWTFWAVDQSNQRATDNRVNVTVY